MRSLRDGALGAPPYQLYKIVSQQELSRLEGPFTLTFALQDNIEQVVEKSQIQITYHDRPKCHLGDRLDSDIPLKLSMNRSKHGCHVSGCLSVGSYLEVLASIVNLPCHVCNLLRDPAAVDEAGETRLLGKPIRF